MATRTQHPRLVAAACRLYTLAIRLYPADFRHAFGHELIITFRNRVEDVLDAGGIVDWLAFAVHIAVDEIRTCGTFAAERRTNGSMTCLGLSESAATCGTVDRVTLDVQLLFAVSGLAVSIGGWYWLIVVLPTYAS